MRISTPMINQLALNGIMDDESALTSTQNQLSTGFEHQLAGRQSGRLRCSCCSSRRAARSTSNTSANGHSASANLNLEQSALTSASTTLQSIQSLLVQANSGTNNSSDLQSIATQIQQLGQQLTGTANSTNATGQYLFAGYSVNTQPFVRGAGGSVSYLGDSGVSSVPLDGGTSVQTGDAGSAVFMNVPAGNGTFTTSASSSNTGTGVIDAGSVTAASDWGTRFVHPSPSRMRATTRLPTGPARSSRTVLTTVPTAAASASGVSR